MIDDKKIMELIKSVMRQIDNMDCCPHCYMPHGEPFPDKRTMSLAIQLAEAMRHINDERGDEFALEEDEHATLTEFLENFGDDGE